MEGGGRAFCVQGNARGLRLHAGVEAGFQCLCERCCLNNGGQ